MTQPDPSTDSAIAVIGMAVRLPGAPDVARYWANLAGGVESITIGPAPRGRIAAAGVLDGIEQFDAALFGYTPGEAAEIDPQQRIFLECAWTALESAGYPPQSAPLRAGVYGGASFTTYLLSNLLPAAGDAISVLSNRFGFADDFLATRVAYELGLTGPAVTVQTGCSTSLVAIHIACQALLAGECDLALAGGVRIGVPQLVPYMYHEGGILSADGHCRAFDARSTGTVPGNGAAIVVLKRLADALADGDPVRAVVLGTAINNDGSAKAGFAAPSVDGQAGAIRDALAIAGVAPAEVSYIEAHGTGTPLGDPIELAALKQVFAGAPRGACGIGTVKPNLGHLDAASGAAGFIKAVLAIEHRTLPPTLHFTAPNPQLGIEDSPFQVVAELRAWTGPRPLRAGVSAYGIGGTNAHVVL
ncbi:MAG TPA: polyketide synthase, partial [Kofleriaceae bacterium]|nr:polyketide synthase [Kofleriaceae bacterium]